MGTMNANWAAIGLLVWSACGVVGRGEAGLGGRDGVCGAGRREV